MDPSTPQAICVCIRCEETFTVPICAMTVWERACGTLFEPPPTWYMIDCPACGHKNVSRVSFNVARGLLYYGAIHIASEIDAPGALEPLTEDNIDKWSGRMSTMSETDVWKEIER